MLITTINAQTKKWEKRESREAVRAVIKSEGKLLLVYMNQMSTYIFPGGGIENGETLEETCIREAKEESGAVVKIIKYIGYIDEFRDSKYYDMEYHLKSHYFECELLELGEQKLLEYERNRGYVPKLISAKDAYLHNSKKLNTDEPYLQRNIELLTLLKENKL